MCGSSANKLVSLVKHTNIPLFVRPSDTLGTQIPSPLYAHAHAQRGPRAQSRGLLASNNPALAPAQDPSID